MTNESIAREVARKVFARLGEPKVLECSERRFADVLTAAFDNYREYMLAEVFTPEPGTDAQLQAQPK